MDKISTNGPIVRSAIASPRQTSELTMLGPTLLFHSAAVIAVCGADLGARLSGPRHAGITGRRGNVLAVGKGTHVPAGSVLRFSGRASGLRAYLAVRGGYEVAPVMGSCSTYLRGGFGGWQGRQLKKGDRIRIDSRWYSATGECEAKSKPQVRCADRPLPGTPLRLRPEGSGICFPTSQSAISFTTLSSHIQIGQDGLSVGGSGVGVEPIA